MSCFKSMFRCSFSQNDTENKFNESLREISHLEGRIVKLETEIQHLKVTHNIEFKRLEDKLLNSLQILDTKIDNLAILVTSMKQS